MSKKKKKSQKQIIKDNIRETINSKYKKRNENQKRQSSMKKN